MKYRGVCLVLLFGFFTCPVIRAEHPCRVAGGIIRNKKCFWIILETLNAIQSEEKCSEFTSTPANIYDMNHFDSVIVYGRSLIPEGLNWYFVHLGMKFDPDNQLLKNDDESNSNLHAAVWVASEPSSSASAPRTRTGIQFTNYPTFLSDGLRTFSGSTGIARGVICETNELECLPLEIDGETQEMDCTDFSSTCTISCKPGFIYGDGSKSLTLTCQDSLEWDGEVPACQPAKCPELNFDGQPGLMHCTGNGYLDKCTFVCESLKKLKGPKTRTCMGDKTWSDIHPTCEVSTANLGCKDGEQRKLFVFGKENGQKNHLLAKNTIPNDLLLSNTLRVLTQTVQSMLIAMTIRRFVVRQNVERLFVGIHLNEQFLKKPFSSFYLVE